MDEKRGAGQGVISDNFSESDLDNLKGNLGLSFEIKRASETSEPLGRLWSNWLEEATRKRFSHGAFLLSEEGTVGAVLGQQTMDEFLKKVVKSIELKRLKQ
jgi:hypothetical protein